MEMAKMGPSQSDESPPPPLSRRVSRLESRVASSGFYFEVRADESELCFDHRSRPIPLLPLALAPPNFLVGIPVFCYSERVRLTHVLGLLRLLNAGVQSGVLYVFSAAFVAC